MQGYNEEHMARAVGVSLPISTRQSVNICKYIRGKPLVRAKRLLQEAIDMKRAVPFTRYNKGLGHKPGIAAGRFAVKACSFILELVNQVEANAQHKGLNTESLSIVHINAQNAARPWHYGRKGRRRTKRCHIEIVVKEIEGKEEKKRASKKDSQSHVEKKEQHAADTHAEKKEHQPAAKPAEKKEQPKAPAAPKKRTTSEAKQ